MSSRLHAQVGVSETKGYLLGVLLTREPYYLGDCIGDFPKPPLSASQALCWFLLPPDGRAMRRWRSALPLAWPASTQLAGQVGTAGSCRKGSDSFFEALGGASTADEVWGGPLFMAAQGSCKKGSGPLRHEGPRCVWCHLASLPTIHLYLCACTCASVHVPLLCSLALLCRHCFHRLCPILNLKPRLSDRAQSY